MFKWAGYSEFTSKLSLRWCKPLILESYTESEMLISCWVDYKILTLGKKEWVPEKHLSNPGNPVFVFRPGAVITIKP